MSTLDAWYMLAAFAVALAAFARDLQTAVVTWM